MSSLVQCYGSAGTHSTGYVLQCVSVVLYGMFVPIMTLILCTTLYPGETPSSLPAQQGGGTKSILFGMRIHCCVRVCVYSIFYLPGCVYLALWIS